MKALKIYIKRCSILLILLFYSSSCAAHKQYTIVSDGFMSESALGKIHSLIKQDQSILKLPDEFFNQVKQSLPIVSSISMEYNLQKKSLISIKLLRPYYRVGSDFVIVEDGSFVPAESIVKNIVLSLPQINISQSDSHRCRGCKNMHLCVNQISADVFNNYEVIWHDATKIELKDKKDPKFSIYASCDVFSAPTVLRACQKIKEKECLQKKMRLNNKNIRWLADIRFDKQIIFSAAKKEVK